MLVDCAISLLLEDRHKLQIKLLITAAACREAVGGRFEPYAQDTLARGTLYDLAVLEQQDEVVTAGQDGRLRFWSVADGRRARDVPIVGASDVVKLTSMFGGAMVACAHQDGSVRSASAQCGCFLKNFCLSQGTIN